MSFLENILKLLPEFFEDAQTREIKKLLSGLNSKKLESYLKDSGVPVKDDIDEYKKNLTKVDFLVTYASSVLPFKKLMQFLLTGADTLKSSGEYESALNIYDQIAKLAGKDAKLSNIKGNSFLYKADIYLKQAKWDESLYFLKKARKEFKRVNEESSLAKSENILGILFGEWGNFKKAKAHFELSLSLLSDSKNKNLTGMLSMNLGIINSILGNFDESYSLHRRALIKFEQLKDIKRIAEIRLNLGMLFLHQNQFELAAAEFDKAINAAMEPGYFYILGLAYLNKSYLFTQVSDFEMASVFSDRALEICQGLNDRLSVADIYKIKGIIQRNLKNFKVAENYILTSIRINRELSNHLNEAESLYELGLLYSDIKKPEEAEECFSASYDYFRSIGSKHMMKKLNNQLLQLS